MVRCRAVASRGSSANTLVLTSRHESSLRAGAVRPSSSPRWKRGSTAAPPITGCATISVDHSPRGGTTTRQVSPPGVNSGSADAVSRRPREVSVRSCKISSSSVRGRLRVRRDDLTVLHREQVSEVGIHVNGEHRDRWARAPRFSIVMVSRRPSPTSRSRVSSRVLSARPPAGGRRATKRAANASAGRTARVSTGRPSRRELPLREHPGVSEVEAERPTRGDVAGAGRDAEGRAVDECDRAGLGDHGGWLGGGVQRLGHRVIGSLTPAGRRRWVDRGPPRAAAALRFVAASTRRYAAS